MNRDDIIRMAREAGFGPAVEWPEAYPPFERFAALVAAAERDDIIRMAQEAGFVTGTRDYADGNGAMPTVQSVAPGSVLIELERFAELVVFASREDIKQQLLQYADNLEKEGEDPRTVRAFSCIVTLKKWENGLAVSPIETA